MSRRLEVNPEVRSPRVPKARQSKFESISSLTDEFCEQSPHLTAGDVYNGFGVSAGTGAEKSRAVRDALSMGPFDSNWALPSLIDANPATWMVMVNGIVVDIRTMPRELQEAAYCQGLIPYVPESVDEN